MTQKPTSCALSLAYIVSRKIETLRNSVINALSSTKTPLDKRQLLRPEETNKSLGTFCLKLHLNHYPPSTSHWEHTFFRRCLVRRARCCLHSDMSHLSFDVYFKPRIYFSLAFKRGPQCDFGLDLFYPFQ